MRAWPDNDTVLSMSCKGEWVNVMALSCAPSTQAKRVTAWRHWMRFIVESGVSIPPIRPAEIHVCLWILWLFKRKLVYNSVRSYLYSLAAEIRYRGGKNIMSKECNWFIHATMKHFRLSLGSAPIMYRRPLTIDMLNKLLTSIDLSDFDNRVFATMLSVGVYCLMRIGEICSSKSGKVVKFIRNQDIKWTLKGIGIALWSTKTDLEKKGVKKWIVKLPNVAFSPFEMMRRLKLVKLNCVKLDEPFFALSSGRAVSKFMLVKFLKTHLARVYPGINPKEWSGISLRKGGATSALRAGVAEDIIQKLGNWKSDAYKNYIDCSEVDVETAQSKMAAMFTK